MESLISRKIRSITPYTAGEQPGDRRYIKLNTNENPYGPSPAAAEAYRNFDFGRLNLYPPLKMEKLRGAIAAAEGVTEENVICGNGSDEILALCFPAFFDPDGKGAAFADITYSFYPVFCDFFSVRKNIVPLEEDFRQDLEKLTAADAQGLIVCNPNAPTGTGIPLQEIRSFVSRNTERLVIIDEAYMAFYGESAVPLTREFANVLVVRTFSKAYSLAGIRCGYAVGNETLIRALRACADSFNSYPVDSVCQTVCAAAIADSAYYAECVRKVVAERERLGEALRERGFSFPPSGANFLFAKHAAASGQYLYEELKKKGVLVRHFASARIADYNRITIGTKAQNDGLLRALDEIL